MEIFMETLKQIFPLSFKKHNGVADLVVGILIYIVVGIVAGALIWAAGLFTGIPVIGAILSWVLRLVGSLVDLYVVAGIVVEILEYCGVLKN